MAPPSDEPLSPTEQYIDYCRRGVLGYQFCTASAKAVFYPRLFSPVSVNSPLEWRTSKGLGTVYATTVVYRRNEPPYNVAMIDLDEGFRIMSRVEDIDPESVEIGMRVKLRMHPGTEKQPPYPVFVPEGSTQ
jgi:uncharacterized OB-fold protein